MDKNHCLIAAAGAGKTTYIINRAIDSIKRCQNTKVLIITLTIKNQDNIKERINNLPIHIAKRIRVSGWYQFLLKYIIRPYKGDVIPDLYQQNVSMLWSDANQTIEHGNYHVKRYAAEDIKTKYLYNNKIYKNYLSEFATECIVKNPHSCMKRLNSIFTHIFIDESQDMAGFDFDVIKALFISDIPVTIVGDPRQHTYVSNNLRKYKKYKGRIEKFIEDKINTTRKEIVKVDYTTLNASHRCGKEICRVASLVHKEFPPTLTCECVKCKQERLKYKNGQCGVYLVSPDNLCDFIIEYAPIALTHNVNIRIHPSLKRMNMGESKGLGMTSCIIYPTKPMIEFIKSGKELAPLEKSKLYVAITRATHIVGILVPKDFDRNLFDIPKWSKKIDSPSS